MIKGIIFDLDMTLVDTSSVFQLRSKRKWSEVYNRLDETKLFDGISNLIAFSKRKYKIGIVTSSPRKYAERLIDFHDLNIPVLSGYHDTQKHKPDPEPITYGVKILGLQPESVIYVGDEISDIYATKAANCRAVGVTWGIGSINEIDRAQPDFIAMNVSELIGWIDNNE